MTLTRQVMTHKYIDDTTLSVEIKGKRENTLQAAVTAIERWSNDNMMHANAKKTKEMVIKPTSTGSSDAQWLGH